MPLEDAVPTGGQGDDTWGSWASDEVGNDGNFPGWNPAMSVTFVNDLRDPNSGDFLGWTNIGFLFGATFMENLNFDSDMDGEPDMVHPEGEGTHVMWSPFVLTFGG